MLFFPKAKVEVTCIVVKMVNLGRWKLVRTKLLVGLLIVVFIFSAFSVALAVADVCPRCGGTGKITERQPCPTCQGSAASTANIVKKDFSKDASWLNGRVEASVTGVFHNNEAFGVYAIVTGQIKTQTATYTNTSAKTLFPPNQDVTVTVPITMGKEANIAPDWAYLISISQVGNVNPDCPTCGGTGFVSVVIACPDCGGTGVLSGSVGAVLLVAVLVAFGGGSVGGGSVGGGSVGGLSNIGGVGGIVAGVAVVGAVIVGAVFVVKKKKVTEQSLRRLSSFEFQDWVAKRLGSSSSQRDSYLGIDGFTAEGYPFQVRQEDDVGKRTIDSFATAVGRSKARSGTIVAFSFGRDAFEAVTRAKLNYRLEIKTVTVRELMASEKRTL